MHDLFRSAFVNENYALCTQICLTENGSLALVEEKGFYQLTIFMK